MADYNRIRRIHTVCVIVYWLCTIAMLIECLYLFIKAVSPKWEIRFPKRHHWLKEQEIAEFVVAFFQLICMSMGIVFRSELA